jgi:hypothetical protein
VALISYFKYRPISLVRANRSAHPQWHAAYLLLALTRDGMPVG